MQSKKLLLTTATLLCIGNSMADQTVFDKNDLSIGFGGELNAVMGARIDNKNAASITPNNKRIAQDTSAAIHASLKFPKFHGWSYGGQVGIKTTTINANPPGKDFLDRSYVYAENPDFGRIELGTRNSASRSMRIHGGSVAAAYGGIDGGWGNFISLKTTTGMDDDNFIDGPTLAIGEGKHNLGSVEKYRKLTLYSPLISGFKLGFSYGPDASNTGNRTVSEIGKSGAKDVVAGGASWEKKFGIQEVKVSVVGEYAKYSPTLKEDKNYYPYQAVMVGGKYTYDKVSIAASCANLFKSKIEKTVKPAGSYVSTVGVSYDFGTGAASLGYLFSTKNKNTLHLASAGAEYKLAHGFTPYAEATYFYAHQKNNGPDLKNSGTAIVVGTRILF